MVLELRFFFFSGQKHCSICISQVVQSTGGLLSDGGTKFDDECALGIATGEKSWLIRVFPHSNSISRLLYTRHVPHLFTILVGCANTNTLDRPGYMSTTESRRLFLP